MAEKTREESFDRIKAIQTGVTNDDVIDMYSKWTDNYEEDLTNVGYGAPELGARYVHKYLTRLGYSTDCQLLDVGAGTGLAMEHLKKLGYSDVDGCDGSAEMLERARKKNLYRQTYCCYVGDGHQLPMDNNRYDGALLIGCFTEGHVKCDALLELIRVVRPGGVIVQVMREENIRKIQEYTKLLPLCEKWAEQGLWRHLEETIPSDPKFYMEFNAFVQVYQVL